MIERTMRPLASFVLVPVGALSLTAACGGSQAASGSQPRDRDPAPSASTTPIAPHFPSSARPRVVILGDSLTAGQGLEAAQAFPSVLQRKLDAEGRRVEIVNGGVSGDTTASALRRIDWALEGGAAVLVVALGGNDGLRGLPVDEMKSNLEAIVARAQAKNAAVLLCGMEAPPNLGASYTRAFRGAYEQVAKERRIALLPFLLAGVGGVTELNQADGIHPNAKGSEKIADLVHAALVPLLPSPTR